MKRKYEHGHDMMSPVVLDLAYEALSEADVRETVHQAIQLYGLHCWCEQPSAPGATAGREHQP